MSYQSIDELQSPEAGTLHDLKHILVTLKNKDWEAIL